MPPTTPRRGRGLASTPLPRPRLSRSSLRWHWRARACSPIRALLASPLPAPPAEPAPTRQLMSNSSPPRPASRHRSDRSPLRRARRPRTAPATRGRHSRSLVGNQQSQSLQIWSGISSTYFSAPVTNPSPLTGTDLNYQGAASRRTRHAVEKRFVKYSNASSNDGILVPSPLPFFLPNERWFMPPAPLSAPDPDDPEPDSSRPVPAGGNDSAPEAPEPAEASGFPPPGDDEDDSAAYLGELMAAAAAGEDLTP